MQNAKTSSSSAANNAVNNKTQYSSQNIFNKIKRIVQWWEWVWLYLIVNTVLYYMNIASLERLISIIGFISIAICCLNAYQTENHWWVFSGLLILSIGLGVAIYFEKLPQIMGATLITVIVMCFGLVIWFIGMVIRSFYSKDPA